MMMTIMMLMTMLQTTYCGMGASCINNVGSVSCSCVSGCASWQKYWGCKQSISSGTSYSGVCSAEYSCRSEGTNTSAEILLLYKT